MCSYWLVPVQKNDDLDRYNRSMKPKVYFNLTHIIYLATGIIPTTKNCCYLYMTTVTPLWQAPSLKWPDQRLILTARSPGLKDPLCPFSTSWIQLTYGVIDNSQRLKMFQASTKSSHKLILTWVGEHLQHPGVSKEKEVGVFRVKMLSYPNRLVKSSGWHIETRLKINSPTHNGAQQTQG